MDCAEEQQNILGEVLSEGVSEILPEVRRRRKKPWMTEEILVMMDRSRQFKVRDETHINKNRDTPRMQRNGGTAAQ